MIIASNKNHCKRLTFNKWRAHFKPIKNHLEADAPIYGSMFETVGAELAYVSDCVSTKPGYVWTLLGCDGALIIVNGFWFVNRLGYFITEVEGDTSLPEVMYHYGRNS